MDCSIRRAAACAKEAAERGDLYTATGVRTNVLPHVHIIEDNPDERAEAISRARAIVLATLHYDDPKIVSEASEAILGSMKGLAAAAIEEKDLMQTRGW